MDADNSTTCNLLALQCSTFPYTFSQIIFDEHNKPVDFFILDTNHAFAKLIHKKKEEVINNNASLFFPDLMKTDHQWLEVYARVALSGQPEEYEGFSQSLLKWFNLSITSPKKGFVVIISVDITERKKAETELAKSEEINRAYFNNSPDGIAITDHRGVIIKVNKSFLELVNATGEILIGNNIFNYFHVSDSYNLDAINKTLQLRQKFQRIIELTIGNERKTLVEDIAYLPEDLFLIIWKDISLDIQNRIEKELYFNIFDKITQSVLVCDSHLDIIVINESFSRASGYAMQDLSGKNISELFSDETTYRDLGFAHSYASKTYKKIISNVSDPKRRRAEVELLFNNKDGETVWLYVVVSGYFDRNNTLTNILFFPVDISKRRNVEEKTRLELYRTLADLAELRDDDTGNHMRRIGVFAALMAKKLNMNTKFCNDIAIFAPLHDIGKVGIVDSILLKADELTSGEQEIMKTHTTLGYNIVKAKSKLEMVADITLNHHERFDGVGYPNKLYGYAIPLSAQITAVVDVYDALRSNRPYKQPWTHKKTVEYIENSCGTSFSPEIIETFLSLEKQFEIIYDELNR